MADARQIAQLLEAPQGGAFGTMSPQEQGAVSPNILDKIVASLMGNLATLPKRAIDASANDVRHLGESDYQRQSIGPALETAFNMVGGAGAVPAEANTLRSGLKAYHGSPHNFDKFDLSKIGTGEGAQTYGHGLYFAEKEATAKAYRDKLAGDNGKMYEVNINADPARFLDWEKSLSQQNPETREAIRGAMGSNWDQFKYAKAGDAVKQGFIAPGEQATSEILRGAGIPGIKYLDQGSRGAGEGSRNFVLFDEKLIDIMKKYGLAGVPAGLMGMGLMQEERS